MRATEQIDAIESLSVDSFKFLVVPRIVACTLALPLLKPFDGDLLQHVARVTSER